MSASTSSSGSIVSRACRLNAGTHWSVTAVTTPSAPMPTRATRSRSGSSCSSQHTTSPVPSTSSMPTTVVARLPHARPVPWVAVLIAPATDCTLMSPRFGIANPTASSSSASARSVIPASTVTRPTFARRRDAPMRIRSSDSSTPDVIAAGVNEWPAPITLTRCCSRWAARDDRRHLVGRAWALDTRRHARLVARPVAHRSRGHRRNRRSRSRCRPRTIAGHEHRERRLPPRLPRFVRLDGDRRGRRRDQAARQPRPPLQLRRAVPEGQPLPRPRLLPRPHPAPAAPHRRQGQRTVRADLVGRGAGRDRHAPQRDHRPSTAARRSCRSATPATRASSPRRASPTASSTTSAPPNCCATSAGPTVGAGVKMTNGTSLCADPLDLEHSKLILLWGTNTRLTNRHLWPVIERARANGARIVVIDPIRTMTAEEADQFVQPLPGTDVAMMLAMMHVIIGEGLTDADWIAEHTLGFDELAAHVADWTPERAAARVRRRRRRDPRARPRVRHHTSGRDPHVDRRRAPRARGDVLPHARLPAGPDRRVARPRRWPDAQRRLVAGPARRRRRAQPSRSARRARRRARST